jgi:hypothetical protein
MTVVRRTAWRALQATIAVVVVVLAVRSLVTNWSDLRAQQVDFDLSVPAVLGSLMVVLGSFAVLIEGWRRVVVAYGETLPFLRAARIWLLASLGKYVPGKVWAVVGAAALARQAGVQAAAAVAAALVLQALALSSGVLVVAGTASAGLRETIGVGGMLGVFMVGALAVTAALSLTWQPALNWLHRLSPSRIPQLSIVPPHVMLAALGANLVAWVGYGIAFLLLAEGLAPGAGMSLLQAVGIFSSAYIVGFLVAVAPAGLGAREGVMVLMLTGLVGARLAAALAIASRLLWTAAELAAAAPFLLGCGRSPSVASSISSPDEVP